MPETVARIVPFAAASGLRQGECFRLRETDIDFDAGTATVRQSKTRAGVRTVHLPQLALLPPAGAVACPLAGDESRLPGAWGRRVRPQPLHGPLLPAARSTKLENVDLHALRHTFISLMAKAGVHVSVIAATAGHTDGGGLLLRRYRHLFPDEARDAAAAFDRLVRGGVAQGCSPRGPAASSSRTSSKFQSGRPDSNRRPPAPKPDVRATPLRADPPEG
jgi:integrase